MSEMLNRIITAVVVIVMLSAVVGIVVTNVTDAAALPALGSAPGGAGLIILWLIMFLIVGLVLIVSLTQAGRSFVGRTARRVRRGF